MTAMASAVARSSQYQPPLENDRAADRDARGCGRVRCGVEQDRLDVQVFGAVIVIGITAEAQRRPA